MNRLWYLFIFAGLALWLIIGTGCSSEYQQYNKWSRKGTLAEKDSAAFFYYRKGDYEKAAFLFEELRGAYRGDARGKTILYHFAYSKYEDGFYVVAAYYFENYTQLYPNDAKSAECLFMVGYCYYLESAPYYLDQEFTIKAITQLQLFINTYPRADQVPRANVLIAQLRERLAQKEFEAARLYYRIEKYESGVTAFKVMIQEYPDSRYREEAQYLLFESAAALAMVSSSRRKKNRFLDSIDLYETFVDRYPNSQFVKAAEANYVKVKRELGKIMAEEDRLSDS
jgi:outer membrane protein assembly factor BamD